MDYMRLNARQEKFKSMYPKLAKWDAEQRKLMHRGEITKEEYLKSREANFAYVLDEEDDE